MALELLRTQEEWCLGTCSRRLGLGALEAPSWEAPSLSLMGDSKIDGHHLLGQEAS
jgi:hypothetical protein